MLKLLCAAFLFFSPWIAFSQIIACSSDTIDFENGNLEHFEPVMFAPYQEIDSNAIPSLIKDAAFAYLINRVGSDFYKRLHYYKAQRIDEAYRKDKPFYEYDTFMRYAIQYYFTVQDDMEYYFTLIFDEHGNIRSKNQLPNYKMNKQFSTILPVCDINNRIINDRSFPGPIKEIQLNYLDRKNTFVWTVEKARINGRKPREIIRRFIVVNASTGKVITREKEKNRVVCSLPVF